MFRTKLARASAECVFACGILASIPASGVEEAPLATMIPAGQTVIWNLQSTGYDTVLTVCGPGEETWRVAGVGSATVELGGALGLRFEDGVYTWELTESFAGVNDRVYDPTNGRDKNPKSSAAPIEINGRVQSGAFRVVNGLVLEVSEQEPSASARREKGSTS